MDQSNTEKIEVRTNATVSIAKGDKPTILFPDEPKEGQTIITRILGLKENGKNIGILKVTADNEKTQKILNIPSNSWAVTAEATIDVEDFEVGESQALPGQSLKILFAQKLNGQNSICFADRVINTEDPEAKVRNLEYRQWFPVEIEELANLNDLRQRLSSKKGSPLTLISDELAKTKFRFI